MKDMIINEGMKYFLRTATGERKTITGKKAREIFTGWEKAGLTIRRRYGMGGKVTWIWAE